MASKVTGLALRATKTIHKNVNCQGTNKIFNRSASVTPSATGANPKVKQVQELYQADDSMPVFIIRGTVDKILYSFTIGLCGVSLLGIFKGFFDLANK